MANVGTKSGLFLETLSNLKPATEIPNSLQTCAPYSKRPSYISKYSLQGGKRRKISHTFHYSLLKHSIDPFTEQTSKSGENIVGGFSIPLVLNSLQQRGGGRGGALVNLFSTKKSSFFLVARPLVAGPLKIFFLRLPSQNFNVKHKTTPKYFQALLHAQLWKLYG